ncbi:hypothetical protein V2J09_005355 [Rumex salicifolius]
MSGGPKVRSINVADSEQRAVLGLAGNKARTTLTAVNDVQKSSVKLQKKAERSPPLANEMDRNKKALVSPPMSPPLRNGGVPRILRQHSTHYLLRSNLSMNASCSSDASSDSSQSRASTGRISRGSLTTRRRNGSMKLERSSYKIEKSEKVIDGEDEVIAGSDKSMLKKRCSWVTPNTEPCYAAFHDEEWGVPVHDDKKLFELLSLSGALAELTWPVILNKRGSFREVFLDFDPTSVSKLSEKKIIGPGSPGSCLLSELKLRAIIENARQVCKVIDEFGSFDKYIWGFVNQKPVVSQFRNPRHVPVKTPKADVISKDLMRRGFRSVSPTVVYSFMQAAGLTNDHLISCYRFEECVALADGSEQDEIKDTHTLEEQNPTSETAELELARSLDEISLCSDL